MHTYEITQYNGSKGRDSWVVGYCMAADPLNAIKRYMVDKQIYSGTFEAVERWACRNCGKYTLAMVYERGSYRFTVHGSDFLPDDDAADLLRNPTFSCGVQYRDGDTWRSVGDPVIISTDGDGAIIEAMKKTSLYSGEYRVCLLPEEEIEDAPDFYAEFDGECGLFIRGVGGGR